MNNDHFNVEIGFEGEARDDVLSALRELGASDLIEVQQRGITGIDDVILAVVIGSALTSLLAKVLRLWKCGVIVDTRRTKVFIEKNCDLPRGSVLVIGLDGTVATLHEISNEQLEELVRSLTTDKS